MHVAFYAPMKPPSHPIPSGDRHVARLLMAALGAAGHEVEVAAVLRSWDGGDAGRQRRIRDLGSRMTARLLRRYRRRPAAERPGVWFTYHLYHKAPDWLGPAVCDALDIPYVVAEASHAAKRQGGEWALGFEAAAAALRRCDRVFQLNAADSAGVRPLLRGPEVLVPLAPFLDAAPYAAAAADRQTRRAALAARLGIEADRPWLLAVGMMREGDKLASYRALGAALSRLGDRRWSLLVAGDGPARPQVLAALAGVADRLVPLGRVASGDLPAVCAAADLMVWPGVNEAFGMALLEAQAAGLPVVAGNVGGIPGIVEDGVTGRLTAPGDDAAFAAAVAGLLDDEQVRLAMGRRALDKVAARHDIAAAARTLDAGLRGILR